MGKATPGFDMSVSVGWPLHSKTSFSSHLQPLFFQQFYIWADISTTIFVIAVSVLVCKGFYANLLFYCDTWLSRLQCACNKLHWCMIYVAKIS